MHKQTVLIIEDSEIMCSFYALFLAKQYEVVPFTNPLEALEAVQNGFRPDMIITDMNMPHLNGAPLIRAFRAEMQETPILVVSADSSKTRIKEAELAGCDDYLTKPFHPAELSRRIGLLLAGGRTTPSVASSFWSLFTFSTPEKSQKHS